MPQIKETFHVLWLTIGWQPIYYQKWYIWMLWAETGPLIGTHVRFAAATRAATGRGEGVEISRIIIFGTFLHYIIRLSEKYEAHSHHSLRIHRQNRPR